MAVLHIGSLAFKLYPKALLVTLLAIAILVKLGFWQIDRGQEKQAILDQHASGEAQGSQQLTPANLDELSTQPDQPVVFTARFSSDRYFLLDNQMWQGQAGYHVLALARLADAPAVTPQIPVNLGWVPAGYDRSQWPAVELPTDTVKVTGRVRLPAERPFLLSEQEFTSELPQRVQYPELHKINQQTGLELAPFMVLLDDETPYAYGYPRKWDVVTMEPQRHYAYAAQWFGLALAAAAVFIFASRQRPVNLTQKEETK